MRKTPINELSVSCFDGEMYALFRKYLEKHGCTWQERRDPWGQLQSVHLSFPSGTTYSSTKHPDFYQITFPTNGLLFWNSGHNLDRISIPYAYLSEKHV